jgi:hypothetical protein
MGFPVAGWNSFWLYKLCNAPLAHNLDIGTVELGRAAGRRPTTKDLSMKATLIAAAALVLAASFPASAQGSASPSAAADAAKSGEARSGEAKAGEARSGEAASPRPRREAGTRREPSIGQAAARERQRKCAAEWKQAKAGGKLADGMKWPGFWSRCNARLKGAAA